MVGTITPVCLGLLQTVAKHPDVSGDKLLGLKGVSDADLAYLVQNDLVRERDGRYRVSHLGQLALKRGL